MHPEAYPVVRKIIEATKNDIKVIIGNPSVLRTVQPKQFTDERFGLPTVTDIFKELEKPGRDPRPAFKTAEFKEGVETLNDLVPGMILEGIVTNVAAFGAFVDIGVHQDGLVHISAMSNTFIKDPRDAAKPGDIVKVKVLEVDKARKRIALSMRMSDEPGKAQPKGGDRTASQRDTQKNMRQPERPASAGGALAEALRRAAEQNTRR